jgi:hypothetical protein
MNTTRLSLIKEGEIVLVTLYGKENAFQVLERDNTHDKLIKGRWVSNNEIGHLFDGMATHPITDVWIEEEIKKIKEEIELKTTMLQKLTEIRDEESS